MIRRSPAVDDAMGANEGRAPRKCPLWTRLRASEVGREIGGANGTLYHHRLMHPVEPGEVD